MRSNTVLLIIAMIVTLLIFLPLLARRTWLLRNDDLGGFHFDVAYKLDELWCLLIWGLNNHTVSAKVFADGKSWAIDIIDWLFNDNAHCYKAWRDEFGVNNE